MNRNNNDQSISPPDALRQYPKRDRRPTARLIDNQFDELNFRAIL